jgi:uncharacterized DUF497 family protein
MLFEWDQAKDAINQTKHGLAFEVAERVWTDPDHLIVFDRFEKDEERWHAIGLVKGVMILTVVHAYPEQDDAKIRIISARRATRHERQRYEAQND